MPQKSNKQPKTFKFKKHSTIGAIDAMEDRDFLKKCFVNTGELDILSNLKRPQCIILGRTGSGKTALIKILAEREESVIEIAPENLALAYLSNNTAIKFFMEIGINMDLFFRVLWRHVFAIEIIKAHFDITNDVQTSNFLLDLKNRVFKKKSREQAKNYLIKWGETFWQETDYRVKDYTTKLEQDLKKSVSGVLGAAFPGVGEGKLDLNAQSSKLLSEEQKTEIVRLGQPVVDRVQMQEMSEVINMIEEELLNGKMRRYYIAIDRLDEKWVNDDLRYRLIRALIETVRDFNSKLSNVKIIVAVREDLVARVFRYTRDSGDQEEKYKSLYLTLQWNEDDLQKVLDLRVNQLIKEQYTNSSVSILDLLPLRIQSKAPFDYIVERTLRMPRDIIMFFNECIKAAENNAKISQANIFEAEGSYSDTRLRALADEWSTDYPSLLPIIFFLKKQKWCFMLQDINMHQFEDFMLNFLVNQREKQDYLYKLVEENLYNRQQVQDLLKELLKISFRVGIIGVKQETYLTTYWSYKGSKINEVMIDDEAKYYIHPAFWRVLGIQPPY